MADEWTNITLTHGSTSVEIAVIIDEEILNKILTKITPPVSSANYDAGKKDTKLVDLLRIEERINIDGHLITDSTNNSSAKKANLKTIFKAGGVFSITYEGDTYNGNLEKLSIKKHISDGTEPKTNEVGYDVKFTLIKGVNL